MSDTVRRVYVEKKKGFDVEAAALFYDLKDNLGIEHLKEVRIIYRYDIEGISDEEYEKSKSTIFSDPTVDIVYDEEILLDEYDRVFALEYLPGQYDQRADSASQCVQILTQGEKPEISVVQIIALKGDISDDEYKRIKGYCINAVECREASMEKPETLKTKVDIPNDVRVIDGFINMAEDELSLFLNDMGLAMSLEDLKFCCQYFREVEKRNPTITEIRLIDTYWSDHCRHTTFHTNITDVKIEDGRYSDVIEETYSKYLQSRKFVYNEKQEKAICLMDIATIAMKELRKQGKLDDLEVSDEINACSIIVNVDVDGKDEEWLVMFKNETHNHPTEIEPFGGAATCLGGAIRDPLSGRAYVYQAMRITGSGDPRTRIEDTLPGKLPQRKITTSAAAGYSSYGNQIGVATGQVAEIYDEGYVAKRMELGAVIGAVPRSSVVREKPLAGDVIILLGGRTGRDGCGGATGSSKEHTEESLYTCGAEVQKGNPPIERNIQRLFRNPSVSRMIKKCNDFGAGGVSVAVGELADGLDINLDAVPTKYDGLDGTELAISESQERMAVVISKENVDKFIQAAGEENLEATPIAVVTENRRLRMSWNNNVIVDINRDFLDTNGAVQYANVIVASPDENKGFFNEVPYELKESLSEVKGAWLKNLERLNVCSQKGLVEMFDSTIGAATVLMPFGGKHQLSPAEGMVAKIPVMHGDTKTGTIMSYGYNPDIAKWSPFHGAVYAIVEALAKIAAMGGDYTKARLTLQEYFEKLGDNPVKWGKPFSALLGAYYAQLMTGIPAIGGKDSMSGTFEDMDVPPTLVAFAVNTVDVENVVSTEFKKVNSSVILIPLKRDKNLLPDFDNMHKNYTLVHRLAKSEKLLAASTVKAGGIAEAVSKMCFGNGIGFEFSDTFADITDASRLFTPDYGSIIIEMENDGDFESIFGAVEYVVLGKTCKEQVIAVNNIKIDLTEAAERWQQPLEEVFPTKTEAVQHNPVQHNYRQAQAYRPGIKIAKPRVFIPAFPGTNCEYDTATAFEKAGGIVDTFVARNLTAKDIEQTIEIMVKKIDNSQIIMLPGGFSGSYESGGSGKFIATAFSNPYIKDAVMRLLKQRDGLILGISNGFQALIKLGLVPYGEIRDPNEDSPTLTFNTIGRHVSCVVRTKVVSTLSPWLWKVEAGDIHSIPVSHGAGRFVASREEIEDMARNGQIATQYVDFEGNATYDIRFNPNGSVDAIEGITSPDGRVFGKMAHSERIGSNVAKNIPGEKDQKIFEAGVEYFG